MGCFCMGSFIRTTHEFSRLGQRRHYLYISKGMHNEGLGKDESVGVQQKASRANY